jgi:uncharacterized protein (DUF2141 family)
MAEIPFRQKHMELKTRPFAIQARQYGASENKQVGQGQPSWAKSAGQPENRP